MSNNNNSRANYSNKENINKRNTKNTNKSNIKGASAKKSSKNSSNIESINRIRSKRRKQHKRKVFVYNLIFILIILVWIVVCSTQIFTKKKSYRSAGIKEFEAGNYQEALNQFDKSLNCKQLFSENVDCDVLQYKMSCYLRLADFDNAESICDMLLDSYSDNYYDKTKIQDVKKACSEIEVMQSGDYIGPTLDLISAVDSGYTELAIYVALCYENQGRYEDMKSYLDIYSAVSSMDSYLSYKYAECYCNLKQYDNAITVISSGLACGDSTYAKELSYLQIMCNVKLDNFDLAYSEAVDYANTYPDDSNASNILSYLDTRVNVNTEVINDIFGVNSGSTEENTTEQ